MEYLALSKEEAILRLNKNNQKYKLCYTIPQSKYFKVDDNRFYVVRVKKEEDFLLLTLAAKMQKEER